MPTGISSSCHGDTTSNVRSICTRRITRTLISTTPAMFQYEFMINAFAAAGIVAAVSGMVGFFLVMRGQTFAGHALSHIGFAGATGAGLIGIAPIWGLLGFTLAAGVGMGMLGERISNRDVAIGDVLALDRSTIAVLTGLAVVTLAALAAIMRPLVFASLQPELAEAKGVPLRFVSTAFLALVALAVSECAQIVGVLLVFTLMVGPPATAQNLSGRLWSGLALSAGLALAEAWLGSALAYFGSIAATQWRAGSKLESVPELPA